MSRRRLLALFPPAALGALVTALCVAAWWTLGERWELLYDATHYLAMARDELAEAPFAYRLLTPELARALAEATGWSLPAAFRGVLWTALVGTGAVLAGWTRDRTRGALVATFWGLSYAVAYGATVRVAADPVFLFALTATVWLASALRRDALQAVGVAALVALGVLAHELALVALVVVGLRAVLGARPPLMPGGAPTLALPTLCGVGAVAVACLAVAHVDILTAPAASIPSWTDHSPLALARWVVDYGGGEVRYVLRIFAAFGPAALFALGALPQRRPVERHADVGVAVTVVALTFLATDTLRVMSAASVVVLPLAALFVVSLAERGRTGVAGLALALQAVYSALVYGHLRTFESSVTLQTGAALVSVAALGLVVWAVRSRPGRSAPPPSIAPFLASGRPPRRRSPRLRSRRPAMPAPHRTR